MQVKRWAIEDRKGAPLTGVTVSVYLAGTLTLATIYSDDGVTPKSNPFTAEDNGHVEFYAGNGLYDIVYSKTGNTFTASRSTNIRFYDPSDEPILFAGHLFGLTLANNGSDATNDIDIAVGSCVSSDGTGALALVSPLTKRIDAAWAVGTGNGGLDIGTLANGTYHIFAIKRTDTGVVDALFSRNPGRAQTFTVTIASPGVVTMTDHGLQVGSSFVPTTTGALPTGMTAGTRYFVISAGFGVNSFQFSATEGGAAVNTSGTQSGTHTATANPVLPANYSLWRRLGSVLRESAALVPFTQLGDYFRRTTGVLDVNANNPGTSAVTRTLSVPIGHYVRAILNTTLTFTTGAAASEALFTDLAATDSAASNTTAPLSNVGASYGSSAQVQHTAIEIRTNRSAQVRSRLSASDGGATLRVATLGWWDDRGKVA
jgi:hypothetical protein